MCPMKNVSIYCALSATILWCEKMTDLSFGKTLLLDISVNIVVHKL